MSTAMEPNAQASSVAWNWRDRAAGNAAALAREAAANRRTLQTYLRYHVEQGLSSRLWDVDEIFLPELIDT